MTANPNVTQKDDAAGPAPNELLVEVVSNARSLTIRFIGELDLRSARKAEAVALGLVSRSVAPEVVLDLADVTFCSSGGLAVLIHISLAALASERHAIIRRPRPIIRRLIDLLDLHDVLTVED